MTAPIIGQGEVQGYTEKEERMKKRRRIQITAFRRRTTIILREELQGSPYEPPPLHLAASNPAPADLPQLEGANLNQSGQTSSASQTEISKG